MKTSLKELTNEKLNLKDLMTAKELNEIKGGKPRLDCPGGWCTGNWCTGRACTGGMCTDGLI